MVAFCNMLLPRVIRAFLTLPSTVMVASTSTRPLAPACLAIRGYCGSTRAMTCAAISCPPISGPTELEAAFGGAGSANWVGTIPGKLAEVAPLARTMAGASGRSVGLAGRNLCARDAVLNGFEGCVGCETGTSSGGLTSAGAGAVSAAVGEAPGLTGVVCFPPAADGSASGEGRGSSTRNDSLVVFDWRGSVTSIWKLTSPVMGGYKMLPVRTWLGSN